MTGRDTALARARIMRGVLLEHGVPEVSIEIQDGRPATGDTWNACRPVGVLSHHIASHPTPEKPTPGLALVKAGRSDLPGPLCNGTAGVDLVYRIICLGYANHPGEGGPWTLRGPMGTYTIPKDVGRPYLWGTEYEGGYDDAVWNRTYTNRRTGKAMTFREFMGRCNAGLVRGIWLINGLGKEPAPGADLSGYHGEHLSWAGPRKSDRRGYTTDSGRAEVRRYNDTEDDMPTPKDLWDFKIKPAKVEDTDPDRKPIPAAQMVQETHRRAGVAARRAERNRNAIAALAKGMPDKVAKAVVDALGDDVPDAPEKDA